MAEKATFSKAPLRQVVFEIRFPSSLSAACRRDEFYNEVREDYPQAVLPKLTFDKHPLAQASQYVNKDGTRIITCSSEALSFNTYNYQGFETFREEVMRLIKIFLRKYNTIDEITRVGLRYINDIPVERRGNKVDLTRYLNFKFSLPNVLDKHLLDFFQTAFYIELEAGTSGIRVSIDSTKEEGKDILVLDLDLISTRKIDSKEIEKYLIGYHDKIEEIFLDITTEEYKESIR